MKCNQKKMEDLISIVIPVYKVEDFLEKCINSLLNQTYANIEIILVDDGSPDRCGDICEQYKMKDKRIKVCHKENGGLSDARNYGIDIATGKYITFVDSDDYVSSDFIEYMYRLALEYDAEIAIAGFIKTANLSSAKRIKHESKEVFDNKKALQEMLYAKKFSTSAWGKLYLRELFEDIRFPYGKLSEDMFTTYKVINKARKIAYGNQICYYYLYRPGSLSYSDFTVSLHAMEALEQMGQDLPIQEYGLEKAYSSQIIECISAMFEKNTTASITTDLALWEKLKEHRHRVLTDSYATKRVRWYALLSYFGMRPMVIIINKYYRLKWKIRGLVNRDSKLFSKS